MSKSSVERHCYWRDPLFFAALLGGLIFWLVLYTFQQPQVQWGWPVRAPWQFLVPVVFYPLIEEVIFRGLLQELLHDFISQHSIGPLSVANILTSLVFTGLHFFTHAPLWAALVFFPSLVFGFFKDRTGRLPAPMVLHVFYNAGFFWLFVTSA